MFCLIWLDDDSHDCEVTLHKTEDGALDYLREEFVKGLECDKKDPNVAQEIAEVGDRTLEDFQDYYRGENDIITIHLKVLNDPILKKMLKPAGKVVEEAKKNASNSFTLNVTVEKNDGPYIDEEETDELNQPS